MIVGKEELEEFQGFIQKQIKEIQKTDSSSPELFNLQTLDSNISLVLSCADNGSASTVELGSRDRLLTDALENYRSEISSRQSEDSYVGQISFYADEALTCLKKIKEILPSSEKIFSSNINAVLSQIMSDLKTLAGLDSNSRLVQKLKANDLVASKTATASASKTVTQAKPAATKTAATKATASKTTTKSTTTAAKKTVASKSTKSTETKTVAKRGRPRKSE